MSPATLLLTLFLVTGDAEQSAPVTVRGLSAEFCPQESSIRMIVANATETMLFLSVSVQRRDESGEWHEFSADVLGARPYPLEVLSFRLLKGGSRTIDWRPLISSNARRLDPGSYRVVANSRIEGRLPGKRSVVGHFDVRPGRACKRR